MFIDVYLLNNDRKDLKFVDTIDEKQVQDKVIQAFDGFGREKLDNAFTIVKLIA